MKNPGMITNLYSVDLVQPLNNKNVPVHLAPAGTILYNKHIKTERSTPL